MIGIICALRIEVDGLKALMEDAVVTEKAGLQFYSGTIYGKDVALLECGRGKVNAAVGTQIMIDLFHPDVIINSGVAGSLVKNLLIGDIVISSDCVEHDINFAACCDSLGATVTVGRIASGDLFVVYRRQRELIAMEFNALCCEMEGGAVGHVCYMNKVPFAILRSISDDFKFNKPENYEEFSQLAADRTVRALKRFIQTD